MVYLSKLAKRLAMTARLSTGLVLLTATCTNPDDHDFLSPNSSTVISITISPEVGTIRPGEVIRFSATGRTNIGAVIPAEVEWSATGGSITADGVFTPNQLGLLSVSARLRANPNISDSSQVSVFLNPTDIVKLTVTPTDAEVTVGEGVQLQAEAELANGSVVRQPPLHWSAAEGKVDGTGYYVAPDIEGDYEVVASAAPGLNAKAEIKVSPSRRSVTRLTVTPSTVTVSAGESAQFAAVATYDDGLEKELPVVWSSTGGSINGSGAFQAGSTPGTYQVIARLKQGTQSDTATVTVTPAEIVSVQVSPNGTSLTTGASQQFTATARMSDGSSKPVGAAWQATGGTVTTGGLYTAGTVAGQFQVIGRVAGTDLADTVQLSVSAPAVSLTSVSLTPSTATVPAGGTVQFQVSGTWSDGSSQTPPVGFTSTGGTVTSGGLYRAGNIQGTYHVIATASDWGKADTATVTVGAPELISLTIQPGSFTLAPGQSVQFNADGTWSDGTSSHPTVSWSTDAGAITADGLYSAGSETGTYRVIGRHSSGKADTSLITVSPPAPALLTLTLSPGTVNLTPGGTAQFGVTGTWSEGGSGVPQVTYSATGGTITAAGLYSAGTSAGTYRVIAKHVGGTLSDTSTVIIAASAPTLSTLTISPASTSLQAGGSRQFSVSGTWSDGSTTVPAVVWSTNGGAVSTSGLYLAPTAAGTYRVIAVQAGGTLADTALVTVTSATTIVSLAVSPEQKTLLPGQTQQYAVSATYSNGGTGTPSVTWSATGGTMNSSGLYTAGPSSGQFRVIVQASSSTIKDTAAVTIQTSTSSNVSALTITPKTITLDIGEVYQFTVSARLLDGTTQTNPTVTWSASAGRVNATGLYTAPRTPGTYTLTVRTADGISDQATLTVVSPTGFYLADDFELGRLGGNGISGFRWGEALGGGNGAEKPAVSNAIARSGRYSLKFTFLSGPAGDDAWSEQRFHFGKQLSEVYLRWYQYFPTGAETTPVGPKFVHRNDDGPDNNKFLKVWDDDYSKYRLSTGFSTNPSSNGNSVIITEYGNNGRGVGPFGSQSDPNGIVDGRRGRWVRFDVHIRTASPANNDGVIELWVDGTKTIANTTLPMYPDNGIGNYLKNAYIMGWANSGFTLTSYTYIDDFVISAHPIP